MNPPPSSKSWGLLLWYLCCTLSAISLTSGHPFLHMRGTRYGYGRNIRPLPCVSKGGATGVCMFAWDCMKANGTHLGTCIDRFYFGSCCQMKTGQPLPPPPSQFSTMSTTDMPFLIPGVSQKPTLGGQQDPDETSSEDSHESINGELYPGGQTTSDSENEIIPGGQTSTSTGTDSGSASGSQSSSSSGTDSGSSSGGQSSTSSGTDSGPSSGGQSSTSSGTDSGSSFGGQSSTSSGTDSGSSSGGQSSTSSGTDSGSSSGGQSSTSSGTDTGSSSGGQSSTDSDTDSGSSSGGQSSTDSGTDSGSSSDGQSSTSSGTDSGSSSDSQSSSSSDTDSGSSSGGQSSTSSTTDSDSSSGGQSPTSSGTDSGSSSGSESSTSSGTDSGSSSGSASSTSSGTDSGSSSVSQPSTSSGTDSESSSGSESSTSSGTDSGSSSGIQSSSSSSTEGGLSPESQSQTTTVSTAESSSESDDSSNESTNDQFATTGSMQSSTEQTSTGIQSTVVPDTGISSEEEDDDSTNTILLIGDETVTTSPGFTDSQSSSTSDGDEDSTSSFGIEFSSTTIDPIELPGTRPSIPAILTVTPVSPPATEIIETGENTDSVTTANPNDSSATISIDVESGLPSSTQQPDNIIIGIDTTSSSSNNVEMTSIKTTIAPEFAAGPGSPSSSSTEIPDLVPVTDTPTSTGTEIDFGSVPVVNPATGTNPMIIPAAGSLSSESSTTPSELSSETTVVTEASATTLSSSQSSEAPVEVPATIIPDVISPSIGSVDIDHTNSPLDQDKTTFPSPSSSTEDPMIGTNFPIIFPGPTSKPEIATQAPGIASTDLFTEKPMVETTVVSEETSSTGLTGRPTIIETAPQTTTEKLDSSESGEDDDDNISTLSTEKPDDGLETETPVIIEITATPPALSTTTEKTDSSESEGEDGETPSGSTPSSIDTAEQELLNRLNTSNYKDICGKPVYPTKRIVGGSEATFGEWPWQVSLRQWRQVTFLHKCGAALLNENWAITAAHCVENAQPEELLLRLGEFDIEDSNEPYPYAERKVQIVATHPQFDARTFEYDLALLRFYEPVTFQPNIIPICVPQDDYNFINDTGYVTGWGRLYEAGPLHSRMQEVEVPVMSNDDCRKMFLASGGLVSVPKIMMCAGYAEGKRDACEGDSGGPLVIQRDTGVWNLAGVISWGIGCALPNQPGVYTRISEFREWIEKIIVF